MAHTKADGGRRMQIFRDAPALRTKHASQLQWAAFSGGVAMELTKSLSLLVTVIALGNVDKDTLVKVGACPMAWQK
jgi:hypothetical protein